MTTQEKAQMYDDYLRQVEMLQRKNSKMKAEHVFNIPQEVQNLINENEKQISIIVGKLERLFI